MAFFERIKWQTSGKPHNNPSPPLRPHVPRVHRARGGRVVRTLDDGAGVGEDRHLVAVHPQAQQEAVAGHLADGRQPRGASSQTFL